MPLNLHCASRFIACMPIFVLSASFFKIFQCHQISVYCPSPLSRIGNITTLFHRAVQSCRDARNKCIIGVHSNLVCVSADILRNVHNIHAHVMHTYMRIPSAEYKGGPSASGKWVKRINLRWLATAFHLSLRTTKTI